MRSPRLIPLFPLRGWRPVRAWPLLAALLAVSVPAARASAAQEIFERMYRLPLGGTFSLSNVNGPVQVDGWEREQVEIRAVKTAKSDPLDLQRVQIEVSALADRVEVTTRYPKDDGVEVWVDYRVRVPYRVLLSRVETVNGAVRVRGVEGAGELRAVNGNVDLLDSAGRFRARTTNGNLRLELRQLTPTWVEAAQDTRPLSATTVNGSVFLVLPADADADLEVSSLNGDFRSELPVTTRSLLGPLSFRARLGQGGTLLRLRTVNGAIRIITFRPTI